MQKTHTMNIHQNTLNIATAYLDTLVWPFSSCDLDLDPVTLTR